MISNEDVHQLKFRNYIPRDKELRRFCLPPTDAVSLHHEIITKYTQVEPFDPLSFSRSKASPPSVAWDIQANLSSHLADLQNQTEFALAELRSQTIANLSSSEEDDEE